MNDGMMPENTNPTVSDNEWLTLSAVREAFSIGTRVHVPYRDAVQYAIRIAPQLISADGLIARGFESELPTFYRAKAATQSLIEPVTPLELASADLEELKELAVRASPRDRTVLESRISDLFRVVAELSATPWTETQAIMHDQLAPPRDDETPAALPISGRGKDYIEFQLPTRRTLRSRVLHPDPAEWRSGIDLIYETYWAPSQGSDRDLRVRVAALQYKIWDGAQIYFSRDERLQHQMDRATRSFCEAGLCLPEGDEPTYRLPHCAAFLRPTDRVQQKAGWRATRGWHVPVCAAKRAITPTKAGKGVLRSQSLKVCSVNQGVFEALFNREMIGSAWLPVKKLDDFYRSVGIFTDYDVPLFHFQEYSQRHLAGYPDSA